MLCRGMNRDRTQATARQTARDSQAGRQMADR